MEIEEQSLLDIFMPEDLCARCAEEEPVSDHSLDVTLNEDRALLHFCTAGCKSAFIRGMNSVQGLPDV